MDPQDACASPPSADSFLPHAAVASAFAGPLSRNKKRRRSSDEERKEKEDARSDVYVDGGDDEVIVRKNLKEKGNGDKGKDEVNEDVDADDDVKVGDAPDDLATTTRRIGNSIDFPLSNLKPHLICSLCEGYFRDPYTVADCLHTFCRSCLILFFRQGMRCCPTCNTRLGPDPFHTSISIHNREVMPDRTLQEIVHKIFPWMKAREEEEERNFYAKRGIDLKPEYATQVAGTANADADNEVGSSEKGVDAAAMMSDQLELNLDPDDRPPHSYQRLPPLQYGLLRLSGRAKIATLKKYLVMKLGLKDCSKNSIELTCNGDPVGDELSLTFILRTRWFSTNKVLALKYRLEEEENTES
ncbi:hypothetical protein ACHAXA_005522 [Cyclostephanos tholiformis]|uniref:RING-type domain-containing protein n=1 Tax=Cyclostephanos tholiformis TaxID=382380 RepID=A0ABD3RD90_9STRA